MSARVAHELRRLIKAHRLAVENGGAEHAALLRHIRAAGQLGYGLDEKAFAANLSQLGALVNGGGARIWLEHEEGADQREIAKLYKKHEEGPAASGSR